MNYCVRHIALFVTCVALAASSTPQIIGAKKFTPGNDATSSKILVVKKHSKGYLLVGTTQGLYKFTGNEFETINTEEKLSGFAVSAVHEDHTGRVWVGMQTGQIGMIDKAKIRLLNAEEGHPKVAITSILHDSKGIIYFSTAGEGVYYYINKRFYNINMDDGLSDNYVYEIKINGDKLIAATDKGINICSIINGKKHIISYTTTNGIPDNIVRTIAPVNNSIFFLGMQDSGIGLFDFTKKLFAFLPGIKSWIFGQVNSILKLNETIWIASEENGILTTGASSGISQPTFDNNLNMSKTSNLVTDNEGNVWFASNNDLVKTSGIQFQNIIPHKPEDFTQIHKILPSRNGNIWVNYDKGVRVFMKKETGWHSKDYPLQHVNLKNEITSLYEDKLGNIWIGTMGKGIIVLNPGTGISRPIVEDVHLVDASILSITGKDEQVWISSLSGAILCRLNSTNANISNTYSFENFSDASGIGSNYIYSILVDSKNRVWFATDGKGLTMYENNKFTNYNQKDGIKNLVIYSLCEDKKGNIWFSALNGGIYKFDGKFKNLSVAHGLNDATVTAMAVDKLGNILAVSKDGINVVNVEKNTIAYFDAAQGLTELNSDLNTLATSASGDLLFSTSSGIVNYLPTYNSLEPKIILEKVQLFLKDIDPVQKKEFKHDENNLSFNYTGISLSHPAKIQYQYQLQGFSNQWISTKDRTINFPKLPAGSYTFKVRVSLNNNFLNSDEARFSFVINKPIWFQWWFIITVLFLFAGVSYWYIRAREKRVQRWDRLEKERIQFQFETLKSQVNPHFLFNSFNTLISVIEENPNSAVDYVEHLSDLYRKIVTYRDKDLITLKEEIELINDYYFIQKKRFGNNLQLNIHLSEEELKSNYIAPLTLQLLAENAVKHNAISSETPLTIDMAIHEKVLVVKNNINPKITVEKSAGMGLQNIQNRYRLLNAEEIKIEKTTHAFAVYIPLIKEK